jgi:gluconolactonase
MKARIVLAALMVLSAAVFTNAQTVEKKALRIEGAKKVIAGAVAYAKKNNAPGDVIAVVDDGGNLMALERMDGTFPAGANVSIGKARTAALFKRPTKFFEDTIKNGRTALLALPDAYFTPLQGGVPIVIDGQIVGGVGVSGAASAQQDEEIAMAGANVFAAPKVSDAMPASKSPVPDGDDRNYMAHATRRDVPARKPEAAIDLGSVEGVKTVKGEWRYSDTRIVETDFRAPGPDKQPTGAPVKTYDYTPHAGGADFDDSKWEVISPMSLDQRRGNGRLGFNWYRLKLTVPERVGDFDPTGTTAVFETSLDDYAEVWVDGELTRAAGQSGGSVIAGWNAENHLVVGRNVKPGQQIQLAIFGVNGPLSNPPTNFIYVRYARLAFYKTEPGPVSLMPSEVNVEVVRNDPALDQIVGPNPKVFKLADGFKFTEGPIWIDKDGGYLLFSDPNANTIYKYTPQGGQDGKLDVFRTPSGYSGADIAEYGQPGSNGLTLDPQGRLTINQHGNHRIVRDEIDGTQTVLADSYQGKRLNSPNDLVYRSDGTLFFTDPPFGFPKFFNDARKQLPFSGVYSIYKGKLQLVSKDFTGPNGIALSPDEKYLYVGNWPRSLTGQELRKEDEPAGEIGDKHKAIMRYEVQADGTLKNGKLFFDFTNAAGEDGLDGIKVDQKGNLYVSGPGGLWVISPEGKHLGTIITPRHAHNMAWGDADGKTLYLCARSGLYRIRLNVAGLRPAAR